MPKRSVVLGLPLTLGLRAANMLSGGAIGTGTVATAATAALSVTSPWITEQVRSLSGDTFAGTAKESTWLDQIGSFLAFADMNAQVVDITEKRRTAVVSIPGRESDYLQDLGGHSVRYRVSGKFFDIDPSYEQNKPFIQKTLQTWIKNGATGTTQILRLLMRTASPVPFMCEHDISMVVITDFKFSMIAGEPRWVNYQIDMIEYARIPYIAKMALLGSLS